MADTSNIDVKGLQNAVAAMAKALGMSGVGGSSYSGGSKAYDNYKDSQGAPNYEAVKRIVKNNSDVAAQINASLKDMQKTSKVVDGLFSNLEKSTRNLNDVQRKAAQSVGDLLKNSRDAAKSLEHLAEKQANVAKALSTYQSDLEKYEKMQVSRIQLEKSRLDKEKQLAEQVENLTVKLGILRNSKKSTKEVKGQLSEAQKQLEEARAETVEGLKAMDEKIEELEKSIDNSTMEFLKLNKITGTLNEEQLKALKNSKNLNAEQIKGTGVYEALHDSVDGLSEGSKVAAGTIVQNSAKMGESLTKNVANLKKFGAALLVVGNALVKDMFARQQYNVQGTEYGSDILRGTSEAERAQTIGEYRKQIRGLGGGNEATGYANSAALQNAGHQFGLTGNEALLKALQYQQTTGGMGISYSNVGATQTQIAFMRDFAKQIGVTDDALKSFYDGLDDMGQIASMAEASGAKTEKERQDYVNKEIYQRIKLNQQLGISLDMAKQQQEEAKSARYGGLANLIRGQVAGRMQANAYNQQNPNAPLSIAETNAIDTYRKLGGNVSPEQKAAYDKVMEKIATNNQRQYGLAQGNVSANNRLVLTNQMIGTVGGFGGSVEQNDVRYGNAAQRAKAQGNTAIDNTKDFNSTMSDAIQNMDGPKGFTAAVYAATEALHGFAKSPLGGSGGMGSFIGGAVSSWIGGKVASKVAGSLAGKIGGKGGALLGNVAEHGIMGGLWKSVRGVAGKEGAEVVGKEGIKVAGEVGAKTVGKSLLKKIPLVSLLAGLGFGAYRGFHDNDWTGAGLELASGAAGTIPGLGTAGSLGIDAYLAKRDYDKAMAGSDTSQVDANGKPTAGAIANMFAASEAGMAPAPPSRGLNAGSMISDNIAQQIMDAANSGDKSRVEKLLESIDKSNKEMNDRDAKESDKEQAAGAATGSGLAQYHSQMRATFEAFKQH